MIPTQGTRADMHCHSTASELAKLGIQRSVGLPECATPPEEVYELAKRRGMDFVTITDHDTIDGCLELADRDDCFISEELTAQFAGEPQAVHVLCYGITAGRPRVLAGATPRDLEVCADYLHEHEITCALAHPFFAVAAPLDAAPPPAAGGAVRRLGDRATARAPASSTCPAAVYIETKGEPGSAAPTITPASTSGGRSPRRPRRRRRKSFCATSARAGPRPDGEQGGAAKWAHSALALATRAFSRWSQRAPTPLDAKRRMAGRIGSVADPASVLEIAERVVADGAERGGAGAPSLGAGEARAILRAWLDSVDLGAGPAAS